ncbi:HAMP domain-containing histidine kinase [Haloterrigena sp. SYSU A121-1]|uniref:histidine kinase n=1 Tax=Haloterrigena gelatinilytica TaxID=2741724 RepID=A0A8J8GK27_9EURY|nr:HAMP domain-containing sensor histidine kinase [Haloterrigena gelatinilytica]NUB90675.1 HAMP domain-containing histidine kinase [Haloterrigena gelatinilytica]
MSAESHADVSDPSTVESERGSSASFRLSSHQFRLTWIVAGLFVLGSIGLMRLAGPRGTLLFSNVVLVASAAGAAVALGLLARRSEPPDALGWGLTAVGTGLFATGEFAWMCYELWLGGVPFPGVPDLFYLADYLFLGAGLLVLAASQHRLGSILRIALDGFLVAAALLAISWQFVLAPILAHGAAGGATLWLSAAYPSLDIVLAAVAFVVAAHARGSRRVPITLFAAGNLVWAFADSAFAYLSITGGYIYSEFDVIWLAGNLIVALAALHPSAATPPPEVDRRRYAFRETVAPYAPFLLSMAVTGYAALTGTLDPVGLALGALVLLALVARQTYVFFDAAALSRCLERNEETLSRRNEELLLLNRIVRHDIRNDMAVVLGWGEELNGRLDDEDERAMLERMLGTTRHTIELTETLQAFTELWDDAGDHGAEPVSLETTLTETLERRREAYADAEFVVDGSIPAATVSAGPLLSTVFRNLLNNAVQHNDAVEPRVVITADVGPETATVRIADNGPGVPPDRRDALFGRGEKGLESEGSGVGLYLVDTLVSQYGGDVWIESSELGGTAFVVELQRYRE